MRKTLTAVVLSLSVLLGGPGAGVAQTKGGKSSSSGGSSGGKSSSSSGSGGRSYSSGGSSSKSPSSPSGGKSSPSGSGGKSYSSGGKSSPASPSPAPSKPPASGSGGKSYSSGGGGSPSPSPSPSKPPASGSGGKSYSSGSPSGNKGYSPGPGGKPGGVPYDPAAGQAQRKQESKTAYTKGTQPRTTYTDRDGNAQTIDPKDQRIDQLHRELDYQRWVNRETRKRDFYSGYNVPPSPPVVVHYRDPYSDLFWFWLLAQSLDRRAEWAYHRHDMDEARYRTLLEKDRRLEERVRELERQGVKRDPAYVPPELKDNPDLIYTDEYVEAAYNPQPKPASARHALTVLGIIVLVLALGAFLVWLVFFKRWGASSP